MKKSLGSKRKYMDDDQTRTDFKLLSSFEESDISKIFDNEFFGYTKVTIEQPLKENGEVVRKKDGTSKT